MERKTFMRNLGDVLLCISIVMLCILCVVMEYRVRGLEKRLGDAEINIAAVGNTNEEIKTTVDEIASDTDAQFESINQKLDEYQGDVDELSKTVKELTTEEVTEEETTEEQTAEESKDSAAVSAPKQTASKPAPVEEPEPEIEEVAEVAPVEEESSDSSGMRLLGTYQLTAYEYTGNACANGNMPTRDYTVACNSLPLGTKIYIEGYGDYVVEDRGGMAGNVVDVYLGDYNECIQFGRRSANVYIYE